MAPETINLPARPGVPEIQIFAIALKTPELSEDVLRCIDQTIPFPIIYQLTFEDRIKSKAAYKRPSDADASKWVVDSYFETVWQANGTERAELPVALDLAGLYEQMLRRLLPLCLREQVKPLKLKWNGWVYFEVNKTNAAKWKPACKKNNNLTARWN